MPGKVARARRRPVVLVGAVTLADRQITSRSVGSVSLGWAQFYRVILVSVEMCAWA